MSQSYPFLSIAKKYDLSYVSVLEMRAVCAAKLPSIGLPPDYFNTPLADIARAIDFEQRRRAAISDQVSL